MGELSLEERVRAELPCLKGTAIAGVDGSCAARGRLTLFDGQCFNCYVRPTILALIERECERVRGETIEECAKLADRYGSSYFANHMRKLKEPPCPK